MPQATALVTNALEFAGPPSVEALASAGLRVAVHDRKFEDENARSAYAAEHPGLTVLAAQDPSHVVRTAWEALAGLDVIVSNDAFPAIHGPIEDASLEDLRITLERLVVFPFAVARAAIPRLKTRPGARVVMITSNRTRLPLRGGAIPDAARAALNALVRSISLELAPHEVPVNAIAPNYLYSETYYPRAVYVDDPAGREFVRQVVPVGRLAKPEEIGELVRYLATAKGSFMTGAIIDFSGGWPSAPRRPE
ncbi:MAG: SDR family oxidoreductase [Burkholderiaceae bacterium]|nr:SDR family oxidoreductase [Burkholderiaceae bacterium]